MNVLLTGASGFVGSAILRELLAEGHHLRLPLRRPDFAANACDRVTTVQIGDLDAPIDWAPLLDGVDAVVHSAGLAHEGASGSEARLFAVNVTATDALMRAAAQAGVRRVVHISSVRAIVGRKNDDRIEEDATPAPTDAYGRSKLAAETAVMGAGVHGVILRPPVVHGAGVRANMRALARLAATSIPLPLADLRAKRSIVSDRNLASAVVHALRLNNADICTALVADPSPLSIPEIVTAFRAALGKRPLLVPASTLLKALLRLGRRDDLWDSLAGPLVLTPSRLAASGWQPPETSEAGLARTVRAVVSST
jgi:nucleoside-diphosphate-sugar epimerase